MRWVFAAAALCAASFFGTSANAQGQPSSSTSPSQCELHVWPSSGMRSTYYGWFHGGIVDGAVTGRDGYRPIPKDPIPTSLQMELLAGIDFSQLLNLSDYKIVVHDQPLESRTVRTTAGRLTESSSPCYAELVGDDVFYQEDVFSGRYLKSLIRFRLFGPGNVPTRTFSTWTETRLIAFPPKEPSANDSALAELRDAYVNNIKNFAVFLNKPAKTKK